MAETMVGTSENGEFYSVRNAAELIGLKSISYTRRRLGAPDAVEKQKSGVRFLYTLRHIEKLKFTLKRERKERESERGKIACYHCRRRCDKCALKSGICPDCQAKKLVKNFACHGDCTKCAPDCHLLRVLDRALHEYGRTVVGESAI